MDSDARPSLTRHASAMPKLAIEARTVNQLAYDRLRDLVVSGKLSSGERLDERVLAETMGISRTPVRDAISRLANEGVVEHRPYQGAFVRHFSVQQIDDLYRVRKELESLAVLLAAERMTERDLKALEKTVNRCHRALTAGDVPAFERLDQEFHESLARCSGNEALISCLERLSLQIQLARHRANAAPDLPQRTTSERESILEALKARDGARAAQYMRDHIEDVQKALLEQLRGQ